MLARDRAADNLQKNIKEFPDLTGTRSSPNRSRHSSAARSGIELASGNPSFDVIHLTITYEAAVSRRRLARRSLRLHEDPT